ncbi:MAG: signal peptidase I [Paenibacillaceae bacterium]
MQLIFNVMEQYGGIDLPAQGNSMFPYIREGDICRFNFCDGLPLKRGDIVLFHSSSEHLIAHRLYQLKSIDNQLYYVFKGDTNFGLDEPVREDQLIGKLICVQKGKIVLLEAGLTAKVWSKMILTLPVLTLLLRMYLNRKNNTLP